jgi:hypothetical protein
MVLRASKPGKDRILGTINDEEGLIADDDQDKRRMLTAVSFPKPNKYKEIQEPKGRKPRHIDHLNAN